MDSRTPGVTSGLEPLKDTSYLFQAVCGLLPTFAVGILSGL